MTESEINELCGWGVWSEDGQTFHPEATSQLVQSVHSDWAKNPENYPGMYRSLRVRGATGTPQRTMLWEIARKVIGRDVPNTPQEVGDCVSWGAKHAIEHIQFPLMASGERLNWTQVFSPYLWGMGRLSPDCGNNRLGRRDGSMGAWQAVAVMRYGTIALDATAEDGSKVPTYSGAVARQWGNRPGPDQKWVTLGKTHLVKSAALVKSADDVQIALSNGYAVTVAAEAGYNLLPGPDGFHHRSIKPWRHQTCVIGFDPGGGTGYDGKEVPENYVFMNSWGDVHGTLHDFRTGEVLPLGCYRITRRDLETMLSEQDSYAYSAFEGFVAQALPRDQVDPW